MSWNVSFVAVRRDYSGRIDELLQALGLEPAEDHGPISWMDAASVHAPGRAVGVAGEWTVVCDPRSFANLINRLLWANDSIWPVPVEAGLAAVSRGTKAIGLLVSGVSDTYGFTLHEDGRQSRCRLVQQGQVIKAFGSPSAEEREAIGETDDEEERAFLLLRKHGLSFRQLESGLFRLVNAESD